MFRGIEYCKLIRSNEKMENSVYLSTWNRYIKSNRFLTEFTFLKAAEKCILGNWCQSLLVVWDMPQRVVVEISSSSLPLRKLSAASTANRREAVRTFSKSNSVLIWHNMSQQKEAFLDSTLCFKRKKVDPKLPWITCLYWREKQTFEFSIDLKQKLRTALWLCGSRCRYIHMVWDVWIVLRIRKFQHSLKSNNYWAHI